MLLDFHTQTVARTASAGDMPAVPPDDPVRRS
jgi:hypothetical protein